jgi:hypothetical protein
MADEHLAEVKLPKVGGKSFNEIMGVSQPFMSRKQDLQKDITKAEGQEAEAKQKQAETLATGKLGAAQQFGEAERGAMQQYEQKMEAEPLPAFIPTKDTAQDIAGLFSVIGVIGMIVGKQNAQQAMGAMNGMLEGHRKGRGDLYKQQLQEFDKNFKSMQQKHAEFRKEMEDAVKLASTDKEAAMQAAELAATKAGSEIVKAQLRKGDLVGAFKLVSDSEKTVEKALELDQRARQHAQDMALKAEAKTAKATQQQFIVQRSVNALGGVASAVESLNKLPAGTTAGILPNLTTKDGMFNYMRNAAGRTMSKPEEKAVETLFTGITRNLAAIEASGAATGLTGLATQLEKLRPVAGDKAVDVALKMADIRRIATENVQPLIDSGLMPKQQAETAGLLVDRIAKAIPYTTEEVVTAAYGGKGKETMGEAGARIATPPKSYATEADAEAAFNSGQLKSGEKVIINGKRGTWE